MHTCIWLEFWCHAGIASVIGFLRDGGHGGVGKRSLGKANDVKNTASDSASIQDLKPGQIIIRVIEPDDKERCRELLKAHHASTIFADYEFSNEKFDSHADKIYSYPENMVCFVAERKVDEKSDEMEIVGLLWASAGTYALSDELTFATRHIIAVHPTKLGRLSAVKTFMRMIKAVKAWSKTRGADEVLVHVTTGTNLKATDRLLRRSGAKTIGGGYAV